MADGGWRGARFDIRLPHSAFRRQNLNANPSHGAVTDSPSTDTNAKSTVSPSPRNLRPYERAPSVSPSTGNTQFSEMNERRRLMRACPPTMTTGLVEERPP